MSEAIAAPSPGALCPVHPEAAAVGACARCGRFVCGECAGEDRVCPACHTQRLLEVRPSKGRAKTARAFLLMAAGSEGLTMLGQGWSIASAEPTFGQLALQALGGLGIFLSFVGAAIAFLMWLHRAVRQVNALGLDVGDTPAMAVGWWFVPYVNLLKPYHVVRNLGARLVGEDDVGAMRVGAWWGAFLVGNLGATAEAFLGMQATQEGRSFDVPNAVGVLSSALSVLAALLCVRIVRTVQGQLDARRAAA